MIDEALFTEGMQLQSCYQRQHPLRVTPLAMFVLISMQIACGAQCG